VVSSALSSRQPRKSRSKGVDKGQVTNKENAKMAKKDPWRKSDYLIVGANDLPEFLERYGLELVPGSLEWPPGSTPKISVRYKSKGGKDGQPNNPVRH